ncbi:hypothetical protein QBC35DRAFT_234957 [Podospora australis]|uniref:Uncharacterized protein n=1 Tax=Podospora australis TaxID=1536484 RepID=A0AAN7AIN0_9PEZI|nr:hypothetical protein QBC35DRAFT_234957 [Podospora australis]
MTSLSKHGRGTLEVIYKPQTGIHEIDVVLVSGLQGRPIGNPTEIEFHDILSKEITAARILLFTYLPATSDHEHSSPLFCVDCLDGAAKSLVSTLSKQKSEEERVEKKEEGVTDEPSPVSNTPLAFVAYDLGGTIVKKALAIAAHDPRYSEVSAAATRLIFFGTPHDAPDLVSWADTLCSVFLASLHGPISSRHLTTRANALATFHRNLSVDFRSARTRRFIINVFEESPIQSVS